MTILINTNIKLTPSADNNTVHLTTLILRSMIMMIWNSESFMIIFSWQHIVKFPYYDSYIYVIFMSSLMLSGHHGRDKGGTCTPESEQEAEVDRVVGAVTLGRDPCWCRCKWWILCLMMRTCMTILSHRSRYVARTNRPKHTTRAMPARPGQDDVFASSCATQLHARTKKVTAAGLIWW